MIDRAKGIWLNLSQSLGFIPGIMVVFYGLLGIGLTGIDAQVDLDGVQVLFKGDGAAARTVLSVVAGSLITVAGLTFSSTLVVLQLASSQFSPRILRTFFGDRITQFTIGTYVGTFVFSMLVLRSVGSFGDSGFVPRLSVTVAILLGIGAVVLLIVFLHHVSQMVQVSHVTATITHATLARIDNLYPDAYGEPEPGEDADELYARWGAESPPGRIFAERPGFVQRVGLGYVFEHLEGKAQRVALHACPGDFVGVDAPLAEVWPREAADDCRAALLAAVAVASERDLDQDVGFGLRQLTDTAMKGMSPGINDPTTAVTCINYIRAILVRIAERASVPRVRRAPEGDLVIIARQRTYEEYLDSARQIGRYLAGDAWVTGELLRALGACVGAAERCGAGDRARAARAVVARVAEQAAAEAGSESDREAIEALAAEIQNSV